MANGSIESKGESNEWPADDATQTQPSSQHHLDPGTPGDFNDNLQAANHLPRLPHPPSPVSMAELQERAVQDSQNNNVDENSNDSHYDQYAAAAAYPRLEASFHLPYPSQEFSHSIYHNQEVPSYPAYLRQEASCPSYSSTSSHLSRETPHTLSSSGEPESFHPNKELTHHPHLAQEASSHHFNSSHSSHGVSYSDHSDFGHEVSLHPDQSVRPRVRQQPQHHRDEPDRVPVPQQPITTRRNSDGNSSDWKHSGLKHCRNFRDNTSRYPPLPNLNRPSDESGGGGHNPHHPLALQSDELVTQEAEELLTTFTSETLRNNRLEVPQWMMAMPSPQMARAGRELRLLADAFACTAERRKVRLMAESVNLGCIEMDDFFHLCAELFYDGITRERIVALFTFIGDVAVHQVRMRGEELIHRLMKWSLKYIVEHVCRWVQEAGGWIAVLTCGANFLYRCAVFVFCVCGSVAAGLFIYKTLKNG